jgi:hypothetical protein
MKSVFRLLVGVLVAWPLTVGAQRPPGPDADPRILSLIASISEQRLQQLDTKLAGFGTRQTLSDPTSATRGIGAARQWIYDELKRSSPRLQVSFDTYTLPPQGRITRQVEVRNVMAVLPGRTPRRVYISGHYDSLNLGPGVQMAGTTAPADAPRVPDPQLQPGFDYNAEAPGANDDASGTVLTMELARVFADSRIDFDATLVFICWAGEEQGSFGAAAHAQKLKAEKAVVEAMFNNDIVGNTRGGNGVVDAETVRVYSVGPEDSMSRSLARYVERTAAIYVPSHRIRLMAREDRFGRGSDHQRFTQAGYTAIVFREANENFAKQHSADDTVDGLDFKYLAQNARVNAASVASLALAPPAPTVTGARGQNLISRDPSGYDASLRWNASPGAVAYRIYWRDTWTNDWQRQQTVGNVTQFVLPNVSIDDFVFGVAAIGADGHESLISAYVSGVRQDPEVKVIK